MTVDEIRAEIVARRDQAAADREHANSLLQHADIELDAHDRAVEAMKEAMKDTGGRRDIGALVYARLSGEEPQTVDALAEAIDARPRQVSDALTRLAAAGKAAETSNGWFAPTPEDAARPLAAAAQ